MCLSQGAVEPSSCSAADHLEQEDVTFSVVLGNSQINIPSCLGGYLDEGIVNPGEERQTRETMKESALNSCPGSIT